MLGNSEFIDLRASELMKTSLETKYCSAQSQNAFKAFSNHSKLFYLLLYMLYLGFSGSSAGEESACSAGVKWSEVDQSCPTFCDPMDYNLPGSLVHGILRARILEWVAISFSRGSSRQRDRTWAFHIASRFFIFWATREAQASHNLQKWYVCVCQTLKSCRLRKGWRIKSCSDKRRPHAL